MLQMVNRLDDENADVAVVQLNTDEDVVRLRQTVRELLVSGGYSLIDQTKMVTAASELARNTLRYGGGGEMRAERLTDGNRRGIKLFFIDEGPGIDNVQQALTDGFTTGGGLGLGLSGAKRLSDEFRIDTAVGQGTKVTIIKWKAFSLLP